MVGDARTVRPADFGSYKVRCAARNRSVFKQTGTIHTSRVTTQTDALWRAQRRKARDGWERRHTLAYHEPLPAPPRQ